MDLTPRHIQEKQFHDAFRGYSHEEVDLFLDDVAEAFDKVFRENQVLHHQVRQIEEQLKEASGSEDMLKRMLLTAQKTAEDAVEEARGKAQGMVVAAERKTQETIANAERRAQEIVAEAITKEREMHVSIEGLKRFDAEYRARLRAFIESQLRVLEEGPVGTPPAGTPPAGTPPAPEAAPAMDAPTPAAERVANKVEAATPNVPRTAVSPPPPRAAVSALGSPARGPAQPGTPAAKPPSPPGRAAPEAKEAPVEEDDEDRSIKELFWGDE